MKTLKIKLSILFMLIAGLTFAQQVNIDTQKSSLKWTGKKVAGEHWGYIKLKSGSLTVQNNKITGGQFIIDMTTIEDKDLEGEWSEKLVGHLNTDDFFGVEKFPESKLVITNASAFKNGEADVTANLTIKGQSHPVTFKAKKDGDSYTATINVDRTKYGVRYGSGKFFDNLGDNMIDDEFVLEVKIVAAK